jgi:acylphosphatase
MSFEASPAAHRLVCYFTGRVQGVGFRYTVNNLALCHNVCGYVRNLPDGRVELLMEGPDSEMDRLVSDVGDRMNQFIKSVQRDTQPATGEFDHFYIRH